MTEVQTEKKQDNSPKNKPTKPEIICTGCQATFSSKNLLFKHLRASGGKCFSPSEYKDFLKYVVNSERNCEKIIILYGYIPSDYYLRLGLKGNHHSNDIDDDGDATSTTKRGVRDGVHAAQLILESIDTISYGGEIDEDVQSKKDYTRPNRSYGHFGRSSEICAQDEHTGAITEIMTLRAPPLLIEESSEDDEGDRGGTKNKGDEATRKWIQSVNQVLTKKISEMSSSTSTSQNHHLGKIQIFGRLSAPKKFNAEMDVVHRRIDYLIPADFLYGEVAKSTGMSRKEFLNALKAFRAGRIPDKDKDGHNPQEDNPYGSIYVTKLKKVMQKFSTKVVELNVEDECAVLAKEFHRQKRAKYGKGAKNDHKQRDRDRERSKKKKKDKNATSKNSNGSDDANGDDNDNGKEETETIGKALQRKIQKGKNQKGETARVLQRKRFHNFTRNVMAHEFLSFRRLDRFYHRATIRFDESQSQPQLEQKQSQPHENYSNRPYVILSVKGDLFLQDQARGVFGLFLAVIQGYIDEEIIDCVFDEEYTHLVPCPFAPSTGLFASEVNYASWEGKMNAILTPRQSDRYEKGWNTQAIMTEIENFQHDMHSSIARVWNEGGCHSLDQEIPAASAWFEECIVPWAERANEQLNDYRTWKAIKDEVSNSDDPEASLIEKLVPPVSSICQDVPALYSKVLELLKEADSSGDWPTTTPKRQLVMVSTSENEKIDSLSVAHIKAKANNFEQSSAYSFKEGQGGASGSFSVGGMPGIGCEPPKGNQLFPELMRAAFELEIALCPDREPSSTIAINRNAQFRPHTDNGAGAGQSRSLIVGLGTYSGGELMVEGTTHDIRYKPLQFNGWTERHWTKPFLGERYSLVWFTPKGCEGVHGIDLCT